MNQDDESKFLTLLEGTLGESIMVDLHPLIYWHYRAAKAAQMIGRLPVTDFPVSPP
jgi:hypothetical protein